MRALGMEADGTGVRPEGDGSMEDVNNLSAADQRPSTMAAQDNPLKESAGDENWSTPAPSSGTSDPQPLDERVNNRSLRPQSQAFRAFMRSQWAPADTQLPPLDSGAPFAAARRRALSEKFPGERLIIPAGPLKVRSNDTDYRFRPHSAFAHMTGLGLDHEPDAVLVLEPVPTGTGELEGGHRPTLYFRPLAGRDSDQFYASSRSGEFWIGKRPTLAELRAQLGLETADLPNSEPAMTRGLETTPVRLVRGSDPAVDARLDTARQRAGGGEPSLETVWERDAELSEALSELRLVKDAWEVEQLKEAVAATVEGFTEVVRSLPRATSHWRGERVVEGVFAAKAREEGNGIGYDTIAAAGNNATTLHWITNDGPVRPGELLLLDAGVEAESLYTADVTRTVPIEGTFSPVQRRVYEAVLDAADAAFAAARPGIKFRDIHAAAMVVLAQRLADWGLLPVSVEEALSPDGQQHRRWMPHGTSHHLGLDVHDCAQARAQMYVDGILQEGMVFTIEPGLYFKSDDLAVPPEYRGIGVRIEDDVLLTREGALNLSAALPRRPEEIEAWMARLQGQ